MVRRLEPKLFSDETGPHYRPHVTQEPDIAREVDGAGG